MLTDFMFAPYINSIKTLFIVATDAHYYKIIEMLKKIKIITLAPTCFGSRRNHHQGAVLCLAKTTKRFFLWYRRSQCYGGISACCAGVRYIDCVYTDEHTKTIVVFLAKHRTAP